MIHLDPTEPLPHYNRSSDDGGTAARQVGFNTGPDTSNGTVSTRSSGCGP